MNSNAVKPGRWSLRFSLRWMLVAMAVLGCVFYGVREYLDSRPPEWVEYSPERLEEALKAKRPVVVCVWADWGNTTATNRDVLSQANIGRVFRQKNVIAFSAKLSNSILELKDSEFMRQLILDGPVVVVFNNDKVNAVHDFLHCDKIVIDLLK